MKSLISIALIATLTSAHKLHHQAKGLDDDLDSLMEKYDSQDKKP